MSLLDIATLKRQLRLDDDYTAEDELLSLYLDAAESLCARILGRTLYATEAEIPATDNHGISIEKNKHIVLAILLTASHFFGNREAVTDMQLSELPLGVKHLLGPDSIMFPELT